VSGQPCFISGEEERRKLEELIERSKAAVARSWELRNMRDEIIPRNMAPKHD